MVSDARLSEMMTLLSQMGNRNKAPSDGLGIYLGDGIPRPGLSTLRSNELLDLLSEVSELRALIRKVAQK